MRFAVHGSRAGLPVASPPMKGDGEMGEVPRRDVDGRVHISVAGAPAVVPQHRLLGGQGEQPVPGHTNTLASTADISGEVTRRFLSGLKTGVSTPRF